MEIKTELLELPSRSEVDRFIDLLTDDEEDDVEFVGGASVPFNGHAWQHKPILEVLVQKRENDAFSRDIAFNENVSFLVQIQIKNILVSFYSSNNKIIDFVH